jgi:hypothetical protein
MDNILTPDWIKKIKAEDEQQKARAEADGQRQLVAALSIRADGLEFWRRLVRELVINAESLSEIGLYGKVSPVPSGSPDFEQCYRVEVVQRAPFPRPTYTDLFYSNGSGIVRCHTQEGEAFQLHFCVRPEGGIGVWSDDFMKAVSDEQTAEFLIKRMVNLIRAQR